METGLMSNPKIGALEDLANVVYKSFMKEMPRKEKKKLKESIPDEVKEVVEEKRGDPKPLKESEPRVSGISISQILSAQQSVKPPTPKRKKTRVRGG